MRTGQVCRRTGSRPHGGTREVRTKTTTEDKMHSVAPTSLVSVSRKAARWRFTGSGEQRIGAMVMRPIGPGGGPTLPTASDYAALKRQHSIPMNPWVCSSTTQPRGWLSLQIPGSQCYQRIFGRLRLGKSLPGCAESDIRGTQT